MPSGAADEKWPGWSFHYNDRGEVDRTSRFVPVNLSDGPYTAPVVASQAREYEYDNMGNRLEAKHGPGDATHTAEYTPNALNQYDATTNVRHSEIRGQAVAGAEVTVRLNGGAATLVDRSQPQNQTGDPNSFRYEAPVSGTDASWLDVEITATKNGLSQNKRGFAYVPPATELPTYDEDGNQTSDGRWFYFWDAENRMIGAEEKPRPVGGVNDPALPPRKKLTFAYDYRHRRIQKKVHEWDGDTTTGGFTRLVKDLRFVYDGWNLIAELDHTTASGASLHGSTVVRTYVWGLDLAGQSGADFLSMSDPWQGAGGVGGLLSVKHQGVTYHPCYDGNGNIIGLQAGEGPQFGQIVARYDYDPFGNRITDTGPGVELCPFSFSTKYRDEETGMLYYGFRVYDPPNGRWLSRDPIGEQGGINLYGMVGNDAVNWFDDLGYAKSNKDGGVPTIIQLDFDTVAGPEGGECGFAEWSIRWKLSAKAPDGGKIVQRMTMTAEITDCAGNDITPNKYRGSGYTYTEIWDVGWNATSATPPNDRFETFTVSDCSRGRMTYEAEAQFHEGMNGLPNGYNTTNVLQSHGLNAKEGHETFKNGSNTVRRKMFVRWSCCSNSEDSYVRSSQVTTQVSR